MYKTITLSAYDENMPSFEPRIGTPQYLDVSCAHQA